MARHTALITGALGQDGSLLAELLLSRGVNVVGVVRASSPRPATGPLAAVRWEATDLTDAAAVQTLLAEHRPSELYHLAAAHHSSQQGAASVRPAARDEMCRTNFWATKTLALALLELGLDSHLVFASSSQLFSAGTQDLRIDESSPRQPATFYGHTKSWSMDLLAVLRREHGLRASSAILFNHESPRRGTAFVTRRIAQAAARSARGETTSRLRLQNIGARVDWSSARDVVNALALMGSAEAARDYVLASGTLHSVRELLDAAFTHVGLRWEDHIDADADQRSPALCGSPEAIQAQLGWQRTVSFEAMITEMVDADLAASAPKP